MPWAAGCKESTDRHAVHEGGKSTRLRERDGGSGVATTEYRFAVHNVEDPVNRQTIKAIRFFQTS